MYQIILRLALALGQGFLPVFRVSPVIIIPLMLQNHFHLYVALTRRAKRTKLANISKECCFGSRVRLDRKVLHIVYCVLLSINNAQYSQWILFHRDLKELNSDSTYLLNYSLTELLTAWSIILLEKLTGSQLVKKFPAFCGTWKFITAFTSARHLSLSWAISIHIDLVHAPTSHFLKTHLNIILPSTPGCSKWSLRLPH